jgi:hypothetical protein
LLSKIYNAEIVAATTKVAILSGLCAYDVWDYQTETWCRNNQVVCFVDIAVQIDLRRNKGWLPGDKEPRAIFGQRFHLR